MINKNGEKLETIKLTEEMFRTISLSNDALHNSIAEALMHLTGDELADWVEENGITIRGYKLEIVKNEETK